MPTITTTTTTNNNNKSPFLDTLPPELRLHIYTHLLVAAVPLKGTLARGSTKYALHTAILRVNHQIHDEASSVFFGRNVFYLSSMPPAPPCPPLPLRLALDAPSLDEGEAEKDVEVEIEDEEEEGSGAFEPPLQLTHLPLVRHLHVDLLYYPAAVRTARDDVTGGWKPVCVGAERYVASVAYVLGAVQKTLLSLRLGADARRYAAIEASSSVSPCDSRRSSDASDDEVALDAQKLLTGFHMADASSRFRAALAGLRVKEVPLRLDFPESYFEFEVEKSMLVKRSLVFLVGQVLPKRGEIRMKVLMEELGAEDGERKGECKVADLSGCCALVWPGEVMERRASLEAVGS